MEINSDTFRPDLTADVHADDATISKTEIARINKDALLVAVLAHFQKTLGDFCTPNKLENVECLTLESRGILSRRSGEENFDLDEATASIIVELVKKIRTIGFEDGLDYAFRDAHTIEHGDLLNPETLNSSSTEDLIAFAKAFFGLKDIWGAKCCLEEVTNRPDLDDITFIKANLKLADCYKIMGDTGTAAEIYDSIDAYIRLLTDQELDDLFTKLSPAKMKMLIDNLSEFDQLEFPERLRSHFTNSTLSPEYKISLLQHLNKIYRAKGMTEEAIASAREINVIATDPANAGQISQGTLFHAQHRVYKLQEFPPIDRDEHIQFYEDALKTMTALSPRIIFTAHSKLATLYEKMGKLYDALRHLLPMKDKCTNQDVNTDTDRRIDRIRRKIKEVQDSYAEQFSYTANDSQ